MKPSAAGPDLLPQVTALAETVARNGARSYDYTDWWATSWGARMKQLAYRTEPLGNLIFGAPLLACELWLPFLRKPLRLEKRFYPISLAHHGLTCLELYRRTGEHAWLKSAIDDAEALVSARIPDAKELCWGLPFRWSTNVGIIPPNQPAASQTAYAFDLFEGLWSATGEEVHLARLQSVARAMDEEYVNLPDTDGLKSTYHGRGYGDLIVNAMTYRIHLLAGGVAHGREQLRPSLEGLINYILAKQRQDGSWVYGESPKNQFIDHYHTCFVIKNLERANRRLQLPALSAAIERGLHFYWDHLFDRHGYPRPYAGQVRPNLVRYESYDWAECLGLFTLFGPAHGFTQDRLERILEAFLEKFWRSPGALRFRIYRIPANAGYPYFRFGMTAGMLAMAGLVNSPMLYSRSHAASGAPA